MGSITKSKQKREKISPFIKGVGLTFIIAIVAKYLAGFPLLSIMGQLVIAILLGMILGSIMSVPDRIQSGISFSSKKLLRLGIILLGMRLNVADIYHAGFGVFSIAVINLVFALFVVYGLTRIFGVEKKVGILTACGTAICGAAAVVAISPQVKAKAEETAVSAAIVALLGTIFTFVYTFLYSVFHLSPEGYGVFAGGTLHEIAHVIAAASAGGDSAVDMAIIVKLTRVALLVPVALIIGWIVQKRESKETKSTFSLSNVPWFIFGFIAMSGCNTLGIVPETVANQIVNIAYLFIAMAMAALGLHVEWRTFRQLGLKAFLGGLVGSVLLSILGFSLIFLFGLH